jgi:hypothetical protein
MTAALGLSFGTGARAAEPPQERPSAPSSGEAKERYLLLTDGRLIQGIVTRDETGYTVARKLGVIRFPRKQVERSFDTVQEAFRYKLESLPEEDPGERLKLARWCLTQHLNTEARAQLEKVLEVSPDHGPAKAMLAAISHSQTARASVVETKVDEGVKQAGAEAVLEDRPGALDSAVLRGAERRMGISGWPVIFDLPRPMAIRRAQEFRQYVHPILQAYCARCHNADHDGVFQLEPVTSARRVTSDAIRANLDATLRLIDPDHPSKSELISRMLHPHGLEAGKWPNFPGSNTRAYQILATWANSLRASPGTEPAPSVGRTSAEGGENFAAGRNRPGPASPDPLVQGIRTGDPRRLQGLASPSGLAANGDAYRYVEGQGMVPEDLRQADPAEFPLPYVQGGTRPATAGPGVKGGQRPTESTAPRNLPTPGQPGVTRGEPGAPSEVPDEGVPAELGATNPRSGGSPASSKPKKPVKIDPNILERLLQRNANRPSTP